MQGQNRKSRCQWMEEDSVCSYKPLVSTNWCEVEKRNLYGPDNKKRCFDARELLTYFEAGLRTKRNENHDPQWPNDPYNREPFDLLEIFDLFNRLTETEAAKFPSLTRFLQVFEYGILDWSTYHGQPFEDKAELIDLLFNTTKEKLDALISVVINPVQNSSVVSRRRRRSVEAPERNVRSRTINSSHHINRVRQRQIHASRDVNFADGNRGWHQISQLYYTLSRTEGRLYVGITSAVYIPIFRIERSYPNQICYKELTNYRGRKGICIQDENHHVLIPSGKLKFIDDASERWYRTGAEIQGVITDQYSNVAKHTVSDLQNIMKKPFPSVRYTLGRNQLYVDTEDFFRGPHGYTSRFVVHLQSDSLHSEWQHMYYKILSNYIGQRRIALCVKEDPIPFILIQNSHLQFLNDMTRRRIQDNTTELLEPIFPGQYLDINKLSESYRSEVLELVQASSSDLRYTLSQNENKLYLDTKKFLRAGCRFVFPRGGWLSSPEVHYRDSMLTGQIYVYFNEDFVLVDHLRIHN